MPASATDSRAATSHDRASLDLDRIEALVFDIDGTLADTDDHLVEQIAQFIAKLPFLSGREASRLARRVVMDAETPVNVAYGLADRLGIDDELTKVRDFLDGLRPQPDPEAMVEAAIAAEAGVEVEHHAMMPGVQEMLARLVLRYPISTVSTGSEARIEAFLEHYGVRRYITAVLGAQSTPRMKPYPDPLLHAAEAMGVAPEAILMIGDTTVDMEAAMAAGAQAVGVLCGFGTEDELRREGASLILPTTSDLLPILLPDETGSESSAEPTA